MERLLPDAPRMRRVPSIALASLLAAPVACGASTGLEVDAGKQDGGALVGEIVVAANTSSETFGAWFAPGAGPSLAGTCALPQVTLTVGPCCYFPPTPPPTYGSGSGSPGVSFSAGPLFLVDATLRAQFGPFELGNGDCSDPPAGSESPVWKPGDTLTTIGLGGLYGAFTVSVPALAVPSIGVPSSPSQAESLTITWQPDPNTHSMTVYLRDESFGSQVQCPVLDAQGTVTIDTTLLAGFAATDSSLYVGAFRETDVYAPTSMGATVVFRSESTAAVPIQFQ